MDMEFVAAAIFREALSDADIVTAGEELLRTHAGEGEETLCPAA